MKKILLATALVITMSLGAKAQIRSTDAFFNDWASSDILRTTVFPSLPGSHGWTGDAPAPLGSGLIVLTAIGGVYAVARRKKK